MPTITDAENGQEVATDSILNKITLTTVPTQYGADYFSLSADGVTIFNMHIQTSPVSEGSVLMENMEIQFKSLVADVPPGCVVDLEFVPPPVLTSLSPDTAVSGDPDFTLSCVGTGFDSNTTITFGTNDEPTTLVSDTEVTTIVKPSLFAPAVVPVSVHNGQVVSESVNFTFTEPVEPPAADEAAV